ncbi:YhjD/YihY/BrkB family envelope integrity protein [Bdellovibrionota bacterium FG-1]
MKTLLINPLSKITKVVTAVAQEIKTKQLMLVASSLAYTTILSLIPLLAVSFAIFQAFGGLDKLYATIEPFILSNLAEGLSDEVTEKIHGFIKNAHASAVGLGGFVGLVFTSMSMLSSIEKAINNIWATPLTRTFFQRIAAYWFFITLGPLALAVGVGAATSSEIPVMHLLPSGAGLFLLTGTGLTAIYQWVPHCKVQLKNSLIAGFGAAILFHFAQSGFRIYTARVLSYSKIYGSLGAVPILLLWIYILWIIVLSGAAFSAALQNRRTVVPDSRNA